MGVADAATHNSRAMGRSRGWRMAGTSLGLSSQESPETALALQPPALARVLAEGGRCSHMRSLMMQEV